VILDNGYVAAWWRERERERERQWKIGKDPMERRRLLRRCTTREERGRDD
jgi:hypothetical protein